jgi:hypothetical protein
MRQLAGECDGLNARVLHVPSTQRCHHSPILDVANLKTVQAGQTSKGRFKEQQAGRKWGRGLDGKGILLESGRECEETQDRTGYKGWSQHPLTFGTPSSEPLITAVESACTSRQVSAAVWYGCPCGHASNCC